MKPIAFVVHGGAGLFQSDVRVLCQLAARRALDHGWAILEAGGAAIDACERAIAELEDDPLFDAGLGSHLNRDGVVQMDAMLMDGRTLEAGAVVAVERVRNPIRVARLILERSQHLMIAGAGAERFAVENGLPLCDPATLITPSAFQRWSNIEVPAMEAPAMAAPAPDASAMDASAKEPDRKGLGTVGAVALDVSGNLAAGTSTGGTFYKYPGRVGDSPLIGCGCYADNLSAAISCTGHGESIMKVVMAKAAADLVRDGRHAQAAADEAIRILSDRTAGTGGLILIDRLGRIGAAFSTPHMVWEGKSSGEDGAP